jgi:hypothetical protein
VYVKSTLINRRPDIRKHLLVEMLARLAKTQLKALLRQKMEEVRLSLEEPFKIVVAYLI